MISTFPSASDVAWTDIFGDRPLPGYQRTYFSAAANAEISINGVTSSMEHERQMDWQVENGTIRAMGYLFPLHTYEYEIHELVGKFLECPGAATNFYAYVRASDDAQHLDRDIFSMLCQLDRQLQELRARYRARTGRELQIVILSDHGHNHAGRGRRVGIRDFSGKGRLPDCQIHCGAKGRGPADRRHRIVGGNSQLRPPKLKNWRNSSAICQAWIFWRQRFRIRPINFWC